MNATSRDRLLQVGELAGELGINPKTIRYYEEIGLLPEPSRSDAGYRLYSSTDRDRLRFVLQAKAIGLSLAEIGEILSIGCGGEQPCDRVLTIIDAKLRAVDKQLRALADFQQELTALRQEAARTAQAGATYCPIIERHAPRAGDAANSVLSTP